MEIQMLTQNRLKELLFWDGEKFIWNKQPRRRLMSSVAGCVGKKGYKQICIDQKLYGEHRLVWLYHYGAFPDGVIDHIDRNPLNNSIRNLRVVKHAENCQNTKKHIDNTSGYKGVYWNKQRSRWMAKIVVNGKQHHLGIFLTPEEASVAYQAGQKKYHPYATEAAK